ncbi:protein MICRORCHIDIA 2-like isoform X1 [Juglans microcarpa x Juglans regia]|uniref:protein MICRORCHIDIA 2-like isoform X1 n=1 Tax=Juglans microcarpa x Juglans regia TaxID=2249226 RepID=UPI001B7EBED0|nr:protein MICRORCHIDIA 2-like isoform X1 [Juglans microcarpa x Juglans regia]
MPPKAEKGTVKSVEIIDRSDEEGGAVVGKTTTSNKTASHPSPQVQQTLDSRSFWKAGAYDVGPTTKRPPDHGQLEHARVHPKFLHSNATSHRWAFGAIAELLDNAVDEIHNGATFVKVDKIDVMKDNSPALLFHDDGGGMHPERIRNCMSLGFSSKKSNTTIGQYGNGFKTSTMRLGADVIVFSRATSASQATQSIGLLSYTFLRRTGQDDVIVPMIDFDVSGHWAEPIIYSSQDDWSSNLKVILEWSPFPSKEELMLQFEDIGPHGTKVIIYNLWLNDEGIYELSFDDDDEDIRLRDEANQGGLTNLRRKTVELQSHISYRIRYSLRAYVSILYLRKFSNFSIILRGKPVQQLRIADELKYSKVIAYKPRLGGGQSEVTVETTFGFVKEAPSIWVSGLNVYHKNRLIRPFWKVTADGSSKGNGVVGIIEANFIEPAHDKQDFERSSVFVRLEARLKQILLDYWKDHCHLMGFQPPSARAHREQKQSPVQLSVGLAANVEQEVVQPMDGLPANIGQDVSNGYPGSHEKVTTRDGPGSISIDQICEENIQLFVRCEEHMQKEEELKQTAECLEKELEEAKKKLAQISSYLETRRKQKIMGLQIGKFE